MDENKIFGKKLTSLVLPIAFQQLMLALVSASDAVMLGFVDQNSMSAVSLAGQIQFVFNLFLAAMTIGTSMFAAQYYGKGDKISIGKLAAIVYLFTAPVSLLFSIFTAAIPAELMKIFTDETALISLGADYLRAVSPSYLLCGLAQIYLCVLKNSGRALESSVISSVCVVLNIILNALFIFGVSEIFGRGVIGAAAATVIARAAEAVWTFCASFRNGSVKLRAAYFIRADKPLLKSFLKYTLPVLGNEFVWGVGFTMGTIIIGRLGSDAIAANAIAAIVKNLSVCFCLGLGSGGGILIGNELGAGNLAQAKNYGKKLCKLAIVSGAAVGVLLLIVNLPVRLAANLTPQADDYLKEMLFVSAFYVVGKSVNCTTIGGIFSAGGDSRFGLICDAVTLWAIVVPLGLIAAFVLKLPVTVVYLIINLDEIIKLPAVYLRYKQFKWLKDLTIRTEKRS